MTIDTSDGHLTVGSRVANILFARCLEVWKALPQHVHGQRRLFEAEGCLGEDCHPVGVRDLDRRGFVFPEHDNRALGCFSLHAYHLNVVLVTDK